MATPLKLGADELVGLRGLGEQLDMLEVEEVYLPLARLIHLQVAARQRLFATTNEFLGETQQPRPVPFIIGVAGSVAVGKSTTARVLQALLARWEHHPRVDLVTTDGFLYPNAELEKRGLLGRKGFPESYDLRRLVRFVADVRNGSAAQFDVFPNPSVNGEVTFRVVNKREGNALLEIYDWAGYKLYRETLSVPEGTMVYPVSLATYAKGAYTARLEMPDGQVLFKKILLP